MSENSSTSSPENLHRSDSGPTSKKHLQFHADIIPYETCEDPNSPILAFSGGNVNIIFRVPIESFRKLAVAAISNLGHDPNFQQVDNSASGSCELDNKFKKSSEPSTESRLNVAQDPNANENKQPVKSDLVEISEESQRSSTENHENIHELTPAVERESSDEIKDVKNEVETKNVSEESLSNLSVQESFHAETLTDEHETFNETECTFFEDKSFKETSERNENVSLNNTFCIEGKLLENSPSSRGDSLMDAIVEDNIEGMLHNGDMENDDIKAISSELGDRKNGSEESKCLSTGNIYEMTPAVESESMDEIKNIKSNEVETENISEVSVSDLSVEASSHEDTLNEEHETNEIQSKFFEDQSFKETSEVSENGIGLSNTLSDEGKLPEHVPSGSGDSLMATIVESDVEGMSDNGDLESDEVEAISSELGDSKDAKSQRSSTGNCENRHELSPVVESESNDEIKDVKNEVETNVLEESVSDLSVQASVHEETLAEEPEKFDETESKLFGDKSFKETSERPENVVGSNTFGIERKLLKISPSSSGDTLMDAIVEGNVEEISRNGDMESDNVIAISTESGDIKDGSEESKRLSTENKYEITPAVESESKDEIKDVKNDEVENKNVSEESVSVQASFHEETLAEKPETFDGAESKFFEELSFKKTSERSKNGMGLNKAFGIERKQLKSSPSSGDSLVDAIGDIEGMSQNGYMEIDNVKEISSELGDSKNCEKQALVRKKCEESRCKIEMDSAPMGIQKKDVSCLSKDVIPERSEEKLLENSLASIGDSPMDTTIETNLESMSENGDLCSDDVKSIASESDDSKDGEKQPSVLKEISEKNRGETEVDSAPTRVRTLKVASNLSKDVIPEHTAVKVSKIRGQTLNVSSKFSERTSPIGRSLRSKSLDPSPQSSSKKLPHDKKHSSIVESEEMIRKTRAKTPDIVGKKDLKTVVRSSPRKLGKTSSTESSSTSKVQSTKTSVADAHSRTRAKLDSSMATSKRNKRGSKD